MPHYLTYGVGKGRAMCEFGVAGVRREKLIFTTLTDPITGQVDSRPMHVWRYGIMPLVCYRYTAYSGFMFRASAPIPGVALGWMF